MDETPRIETGPLQIDDDWPGVFIRGDNAFGYAMALEAVLAYVRAKGLHVPGGPWLYVAQCDGLLGVLRSSKVEGGKDPEGLQRITRARAALTLDSPSVTQEEK